LLNILGSYLALPEPLQWLGRPLPTFLVNLLVWLLVAFAVFALGRLAVMRLSRRSRTLWDDILVGIVRKPAVALVVAYGLLHSWELAFGASPTSDTLQRLYRGVAIMSLAYVGWRVLYDVVIAYLRPKVLESDSQADDIIIPILGRIGPVIIIVALANAVVATLGGNLASLLTGLGLLGLVIGYLFQEPLQGLFSGTYMVLDNPFRQDDLLLLDDGKICQVRRVGIRVTQLYDVKRHVLIYIPNAKLAATNIVNMTKPSLELRLVLPLSLDRRIDLSAALAAIEEVCNAHPNILGLWSVKKAAMTRRLGEIRRESARVPAMGDAGPAALEESEHLRHKAERLEGEMLRLETEHHLRYSSESFSHELLMLMKRTADLEDGGLNDSEREGIRSKAGELLDQYDTLVEQITAWMYWLKITQYELSAEGCRNCPICAVRSRLDQTYVLDLDLVAACPTNGGSLAPLARREDVSRVHSSDTEADKAVLRAHFVDRANYMDYWRLWSIWHRNILHVYRGLLALQDLDGIEGENEYRLDDKIATLERHFSDTFLLRVGRWQVPSANLVEATPTSVRVQLEVFIDDLVREQFQREERVTTELLLEIDRRLRDLALAAD